MASPKVPAFIRMRWPSARQCVERRRGTRAASASSQATMSPGPRTSTMPPSSSARRAQAGPELLAARVARCRGSRLGEHVDGGDGGRAADRVAAVGAAVAAGGPAGHELGRRADRGDREARRQALGHHDDVGPDAVLLDAEHRAGATEAALHLVGDEQDPVLAADRRRAPAGTRSGRGRSRPRRAPARCSMAAVSAGAVWLSRSSSRTASRQRVDLGVGLRERRHEHAATAAARGRPGRRSSTSSSPWRGGCGRGSCPGRR